MEFSLFSRQFHSASGILQLMDDLGDALSAKERVYMLGGGNPSHIPPAEKHYRAAMEALLQDGNAFDRMVGDYDSPQGNAAFLEALAELLHTRFGWDVTPANIAVTNGSQSSFAILFNLLAGEFADGSRKKILLPLTPEYIGYADVGLCGQKLFTARKPIIEKLDGRQFKYHVDFDHLQIDSGIGAVCLSRPTNPTGNVVTDEELSHLRRMAAEANIPLILDGAYGLPFPGIIFGRATPVWDANTILCLSLSKLGLPGARTGIVVADEQLIRMLSGSNAIFSLAPGSFGPALVTDMLKSGELLEVCEQEIVPYYRRKVEHALETIDALMGDIPLRVHVPEGAIFLWLWFENLPITNEELYQRLKRRGVLVIAGQHFFPGLDEPWEHKHQCIRMTYSANEKDVEKGIEIMADELRKIYSAMRDSR